MSNAIDNFENKILTCPACNLPSATTDWIDCETYCEDCGSHEAVECPLCEERFDCIGGYDKIKESSSLSELILGGMNDYIQTH